MSAAACSCWPAHKERRQEDGIRAAGWCQKGLAPGAPEAHPPRSGCRCLTLQRALLLLLLLLPLEEGGGIKAGQLEPVLRAAAACRRSAAFRCHRAAPAHSAPPAGGIMDGCRVFLSPRIDGDRVPWLPALVLDVITKRGGPEGRGLGSEGEQQCYESCEMPAGSCRRPARRE